MKIAAEDYAGLKAFWVAMLPTVLPKIPDMPPEIHPVAVLERFEKTSAVKARIGLGMAIGDLIEQTADFTSEQMAAVDANLASRQIVTLTEVRARFARNIRRIMQRGIVKNEREYHALRNVADAMPEGQRETAWRMLDTFGTST